MDQRQVQYFLSIVEKGSFSSAADYHYVSQSTLSKKIIALEEELGITLFDRSKRNVKLTEAGESFLGHAQRLNDTYKSMVDDLKEFKFEGESLAIGTIPVVTEYGITGLIAGFRQHYPHINISMQELDGMNILPALEDHRFDIAFTRQNYLDHDKYDSFLVINDIFKVIVSKNNPLASRSSIQLKELSDQNFIVFDQVTGLHRVIIDECSKVGFEPTIFYSSHQKMSVFSLVGANIGIALMPVKIFDYHKTPEITAIVLEDTIECNIVLVSRKNRKRSVIAGTFIDFIKRNVSTSI
jgi:LysR family transcriptional activator of glutamate synthase operon